MKSVGQPNPTLHHISETYQQYYGPLMAYAMRFLPKEEAEDVVQDVFSTYISKEIDARGKTELRNFLYLSVRNKCLDVLKHRSVVREYIAEASQTIDRDTEDEMFAGEVYARLFAQINKLPRRQRETMLQTCEGKSNAEIAMTMNVSMETVKNQKYKAIVALKQMMDNKLLSVAFFVSLTFMRHTFSLLNLY